MESLFLRPPPFPPTSHVTYSYSSSRPFRRLWRPKETHSDHLVAGDDEETAPAVPRKRKGNWVTKILRVRMMWEDDRGDEEVRRRVEEGDRCVGCCNVEEEEEVGEEEVVGREVFERLLRRVGVVEAKVFARLCYLGSLAYCIPNIKTRNLLKYHGLRFVTSSLEKKAEFCDVVIEKPVTKTGLAKKNERVKGSEIERKRRLSMKDTYQVAASAASYLQSQTKGILPFRGKKADAGTDSPEEVSENDREANDASESEQASFFATTDSVTAVVAGKEEMKEAFSKELNSSRSSPCEWFVCDDDVNGIRYFVIQGSDSLASWQANLLFEPVQFEGMDVLVHRGIYEAAKGIYEQMLPEIKAHLESHGERATMRFTGHSLGGSLSVLVNLMLSIRGEAPISSLLPVVTYGAPAIMCGGNQLLKKLGLPLSHVQAITMHRDIVPRAFSCTYPDRVVEILKAVNGNFRTHPCLKHQKLLYSPMGETIILQPDDNFSPHHHLLPAGVGLYVLAHPSDSTNPDKLLNSALSAFLNSPHPLEILSDRSAYGPNGAINRDHDMNSYLRSVRSVIRLELKRIKKARRERARKMWMPLGPKEGDHIGSITKERSNSRNPDPNRNDFSGMFKGGRESLKRFGRFVASRQVHVIIVFLLPTRLLLLEALEVSF